MKPCNSQITFIDGEMLDSEKRIRESAANEANAEDADIWRWFAGLVEERRIRWCFADGSWLVSVDRRHLGTEASFDHAIRAAKRRISKGDPELPRRRVA